MGCLFCTQQKGMLIKASLFYFTPKNYNLKKEEANNYPIVGLSNQI
jgi:hypothetical protein